MAKENTTERYISKYLNLRLVTKASFNREVEGRVVTIQGHSIRFSNGVYETSDPAEIEFLDNHPNIKNGVFMKINKKVKDAMQAQRDLAKSGEEKRKELEALDAEIARKKKTLSNLEAGKEENEEDEEEDDGLEDMNKEALLQVAEAEGIEINARAKNADIIDAIRTKRAEAGDKPEF